MSSTTNIHASILLSFLLLFFISVFGGSQVAAQATVSVTDFGAVPFDGIDDSAAFQSAVDVALQRGEYHSKTPSFVGAWIRARNNTTFDKSQQRRLVVEDTRFDEGAAYAIDVKNVAWVHVHGIFVNVNGTTPGRGIRLMDVEYARVEMSTFGWSRFRRPAIETFNTGGLDVSALRFSEQVFFLVNNGLRELKVEFCPACTASFTSPLKATNR